MTRLTADGALSLRWHTRLAGHVERRLADQPLDLEGAVALAWLDAAEDLPGMRLVLDHHTDNPVSSEMARALSVATGKKHEMLALMAGRASASGAAARRVGRSIERCAGVVRPGPRRARPGDAAPSLVRRIRAVLAAWLRDRP